MNTDLPTEPDSDGWISFHRVQGRGFTLVEHSRFRLPEDSSDDRVFDAAGINLYPSELQVAGESLDLNAVHDAWSKPRSPAQEAEDYEECARRAASPSPGEPAGGGDPGPWHEEFRQLAKIWREVGTGTVTEESRTLVRSRLDLVQAWALLGDQVLEDSSARATERILMDVQRLRRWVVEGRAGIGQAYFDLVTTMVHQLNQLSAADPALMDEVIRWRVRWPALTAAHPSFRAYDTPPEELGAGYPFRMDKGSRWRPDLDTCQVAMHLVFFLHRLRIAVLKFAKEGKHPPTRFEERLRDVMALKPLPDAVEDWWKAAAGYFCEGYPEPEQVPRFCDWVTAPSHRKSPKEMRRRIVEKLQESFVSILGGNKLR